MVKCMAYDLLKEKFPEAVRGVEEFRGETTVTVDKAQLRAVLKFLKESETLLYDLLVDVAGVDSGSGSPRFLVAYLLHSIKFNNRLRIKIRVAEGEALDTVSDIWKAADWLERETYDLVGIRFNGHPNLVRILLPEGWMGHPLQKDYDMNTEQFVTMGENGEDIVSTDGGNLLRRK